MAGGKKGEEQTRTSRARARPFTWREARGHPWRQDHGDAVPHLAEEAGRGVREVARARPRSRQFGHRPQHLLFSRGHQPAFAGINTFMKAPYCEDIRKIGDYEAAFVGAPFNSATTYRPGTRFGPQAVRRISALYDGYWFDGGVDIYEELDLCDAGDIFVIPGNIEKTFDQVTKAVSHIYTSGVFPDHLRRRPQPRLSQRARDRAAYRRQCRHHPHRPPHRYPGEGYG